MWLFLLHFSIFCPEALPKISRCEISKLLLTANKFYWQRFHFQICLGVTDCYTHASPEAFVWICCRMMNDNIMTLNTSSKMSQKQLESYVTAMCHLVANLLSQMLLYRQQTEQKQHISTPHKTS